MRYDPKDFEPGRSMWIAFPEGETLDGETTFRLYEMFPRGVGLKWSAGSRVSLYSAEELEERVLDLEIAGQKVDVYAEPVDITHLEVTGVVRQEWGFLEEMEPERTGK